MNRKLTAFLLQVPSGGSDAGVSGKRRGKASGRRGFTLVEMLFVAAIIVILASLTAPAMRGLLGVSGARGGVNTLAAVLDQARLTAMQTGASTHVGFPFGISDRQAAFSSVVVFRDDATNTAPNPPPIPVSRWVKMPSGVFLEKGTGFDLARRVTNVPATALPKLASTTNVITVTDLEIISFDRFGKLLSASATAPSIRVGEKAQPEGAWIPDGSSNFFELNIQPLTGRAVVIDRRATAR